MLIYTQRICGMIGNESTPHLSQKKVQTRHGTMRKSHIN